jgi:hypothetical protein
MVAKVTKEEHAARPRSRELPRIHPFFFLFLSLPLLSSLCGAHAAAAAMQDVQREFPGLIAALLRAPPVALRPLVERHFAAGASLTHPLLLARGREKVLKV